MTNDQFPMSNEGINYLNKRHLNWILVILSLVITAAGGFGCAKTVTPTNFGSTMTVIVTLRGNADTLHNRYFMVLGSALPALRIPLPFSQDLSDYEFLEPDVAPYGTAHSADDYFNNFFNTWAGYLVLDNTNSYYLAHGPFARGAAVARTPFAYFNGGNTLTFNFQLGQIYTSTAGVPANAYFDVVTVPWLTPGLKIAADHLTSSNYISTSSGTTKTFNGSDTYTAPADASLDIQKVVVNIN